MASSLSSALLIITLSFKLVSSSTYTCYPSSQCFIDCSVESCAYTTIDALEAQSLTLNCNQNIACAYTAVYLPLNPSERTVITCSNDNSCRDIKLYHNATTEGIELTCSQIQACDIATLFASDATTISVHCLYEYSCSSMKIYSENVNDLSLYCGNMSCPEVQVYAQNAQSLNIAADGFDSISNSEIHGQNAIDVNVNSNRYNGFHDSILQVENANNVYIECNAFGSCSQSIIHAENSNNFQIRCFDENVMKIYLPAAPLWNAQLRNIGEIELYSADGFASIEHSNLMFAEGNNIGDCNSYASYNLSCDSSGLSTEYVTVSGSPDSGYLCDSDDICGCHSFVDILTSYIDSCDLNYDDDGSDFDDCFNSFECDDGSNFLCDLYVCDGELNCDDGSDETSSICRQYGHKDGYNCKWINDRLNVSDLTSARSESDRLSEKEAQLVVDISNGIKNIGIDIGDNIVIITLTFINIITSIFVISGLYLYQHNVGFKHMDINYVVGILIMLQMMVLSALRLTQKEIYDCTLLIGPYIRRKTISWYDLSTYIFSATILSMWFKNICVGNLKCRYFHHFVTFLAVCFPASLKLIPHFNFSFYDISFYHTAQGSFILMCCCYIINKRFRSNKSNCFQNDKYRKCVYSIIITCYVLYFIPAYGTYVVLDVIFGEGSPIRSSCLMWGVWVLINPIFLVAIVCLLFAETRYMMMVYLLNLGIISSGYLINTEFCGSIMNVVYLLHSIYAPVCTVLLFLSNKESSKWISQLVSVYIITFNIGTDIIVIYYFIESGDYFFAILEISFILFGQIFGTFSSELFGDIQTKLNLKDKILSSLGFGRSWFLVKSWSDEKYENVYYKKLAAKHLIWEYMVEETPSLILQIYASLVMDKFSLQILSSILIELISITRNVWMYLIEVGYKENDDTKLEKTEIELVVEKDNQTETKCDIAPDQKETETKRDISAETIDTESGEVEEWLRNQVKLPQYYNMLVDSGFNTLEIVKEITEFEYLDHVGIKNKAHQIIMIKRIKELNEKRDGSETKIKDKMNEKPEKTEIDIKNKTEASSSSYLSKLFEDKTFHVSFFAFMVSDLYIRSIPLVIFISSIPCNDENAAICWERVVAFVVLCVCLLAFEFVINIKMRIKEYQSIAFVSQIFVTSILSSFYTLLCTLDLLKKDKFFGKSVQFRWFLIEYRIRIGLSMIIMVINFVLMFWNSTNTKITVSTLLLVYLILLIINHLSMKQIAKFNQMSNSISNMITNS